MRGKLTRDGITFYQKKGKTIMRSATTEQPFRRTRGQFISRQRVASNMGLWKRLKEPCKPILNGGASSYARFCTLMRKMPVTFLTKEERSKHASVMIPGMPVSDGMLPNIEYRLGEADGRPALLTSLKINDSRTDAVGALYGRSGGLRSGETLWLYRLEQRTVRIGDTDIPWLSVRVEAMVPGKHADGGPFEGIEMRKVDGCLALVGEVFADDTMGWALVRVKGLEVSSQAVETRNTLYEQYTTEEAL